MYTRNAILGVRKSAKQSNVNRIDVNTDFFFLPGHVSAAGERCLDCVVGREGDPGAVDRRLCVLSLILYRSLWKLREVLVFGV